VEAGSVLRHQVALLSPLSDERQVLRTTMLPSLIEVLQYNTRRKQPDAAIFEIGKTYHPAGNDQSALPDEPLTIAIALQGKQPVRGPLDPVQSVDFFTLKGIVTTLLERLGIKNVQYVTAGYPWLHPGRSAVLMYENEQIGYLGAIHPEVADRWDLHDPYYAELQVESLNRFARPDLKVQAIPRFPASDRDLAVLLPATTPVGDVMNSIQSIGGELLETVSLFDIYQGEQVPAGSKSVALTLIYRDPQRTLTDEEVACAHEKIVSYIVERYGAELRK
ncbi:MAG: phenylalanine--tRNA ligase subunit beta, partial [Bacilli bacterium]|nr:phenylalanine--tRNA ligase subunit beta [Bacilli bacterium]